MNPTSNERGELRLPAPVSELPPAAQEANSAADKAPETAAASPEQTASPAATMPALTAVPLPPMPATPPASVPADDVTTTTSTDVPNTAGDVDLIEKEWVNKAKQIVERTRDDPHEQSKEMTIMKADYLKKRYNKTIKLSE